MIGRQFLRFCIVGAVGFVLDSTVLYLMVTRCGSGLYTGRLVSYLLAATATWALNRRITFPGHYNQRGWRWQWAKFVAANAVGGAVNYGIYILFVANLEICIRYPVLAVGAGSICGLGLNFTTSSRYVFRTYGRRMPVRDRLVTREDSPQ